MYYQDRSSRVNLAGGLVCGALLGVGVALLLGQGSARLAVAPPARRPAGAGGAGRKREGGGGPRVGSGGG